MANHRSRRRPIIEAMARVVGRKGYRAATVGDAIAEAGVSRTTFYKHFADKHDCFLATFDLVAERVLAAVEAGCDAERPWLERVQAGLAALVELLAADPELARVAIVEVVVAGAEARQRQLATIGQIARLLDGRREPGEELPASTSAMAANAVTGLLFDEIQAGHTAELPRDLPDLLFALLVPYLGPGEAAEEVRRLAAQPTASR